MPSLSLKTINKMNNNPLNDIRSLGKDYDIHIQLTSKGMKRVRFSKSKELTCGKVEDSMLTYEELTHPIPDDCVYFVKADYLIRRKGEVVKVGRAPVYKILYYLLDCLSFEEAWAGMIEAGYEKLTDKCKEALVQHGVSQQLFIDWRCQYNGQGMIEPQD